jgi:dTDP-4-amino-4,6-dideoxygalactose transaminase
VDVKEDTFNLDPAKIEAAITPETMAIMPVHCYGNPCDVEAIKTIADKYNLKIIYDAAHAFGAKVDGVPIGKFGDVSMFSFHATKLFNTIEGGCLTFNQKSLKEKSDLLKNFGIRSEEEVI